MAYNNYFPAGYQPYQNYPMQNNAYQQMNTQQQMQGNGIVWVSGEAGAKAYLVAPNTSVALWDSEANVIYIKSADASGMPSIKILDYNVRDNEPRKAESAPQADFVTHNELADIQKEIDALKAKLERTADKRNGGKNDGK